MVLKLQIRTEIFIKNQNKALNLHSECQLAYTCQQHHN